MFGQLAEGETVRDGWRQIADEKYADCHEWRGGENGEIYAAPGPSTHAAYSSAIRRAVEVGFCGFRIRVGVLSILGKWDDAP